MQIPQGFVVGSNTLHDRIIVITGATTQPGRSVATACCRAGAAVILIDKSLDNLNQLYDELADIARLEPAIMPLDLSELDHPMCEQITDTLEREYPCIDGLVHCAMWGAPLAPLELITHDAWWRVLENQLVAPWQLTRTLLPALKKSAAGRVVFTTLPAARQGQAYWGVYGAAFAAIENMVQTWNDEQEKQSLDFYTLDPGPIKTELRAKLFPGDSGGDLMAADDASVINRYLYLLQSNELTTATG